MGTRKSNESITSAMSRFKFILLNLCRDEPKEVRQQTLEREGTRMLKNIAMPEALSTLEREENKSRGTGALMTYKNKLKLVQAEERILEKEREKLEKPKTPQTNHINYDDHESQSKEKIHPTTNSIYYDEYDQRYNHD